MKKNIIASLTVLFTTLSLANPAPAAEPTQKYPSQPVKIVVPYTPGGISDLMGRSLASYLEKKWGQSVIVENKPGASEAVGAAYVAKSKPDGYTILLASDTAFVVNPFLKKNLNYNPETDFEPITRMAEGYMTFLVVRADLGITTLKELLDKAQKNPGQVTYGSEAVGSPAEFRMRILGGMTGGYKMNHIPYNGMGPIVSDMLGRRVDSAWLPTHLAKQQIEAKTMIPLATNGNKRNWMFPEVPTLTDLGYPSAGLTFKIMLAAPVGTPKSIVDQIANDIRAIVKDPAFDEKHIHTNGYMAIADTPEQFRDYLKSARPFLQQVIKEAGFEPQ